MKVAAVSELKASLSRFLSGVKAGEEVVVTERGKPIARIVPTSPGDDSEQLRLQEMELRGMIRLGGGKLPKGFWDAVRPEDPAGAVRQALGEERRESR